MGRVSGRATVSVVASLGAAVVFEALTLPGLQNTTLWADTPWRNDPYHTAVFLAALAVPPLAGAIAVRLLAATMVMGDRVSRTLRASGLMTAIVGLALGFEWAAVAAGEPARSWGLWTAVQVGGLALATALVVPSAVLLARCRRCAHRSGASQPDWLEDLVAVSRPIPVLRRAFTPRGADWVRRHAFVTFLVPSVLVGAALTVGQAVGEGWTNPLLIAWLVVAVTALVLCLCLIGNATVGFVARPPRGRARRVAEDSLVAGCIGVVAAIGFHHALWSALGTGPLTATALVALTLGAGLATALVTAAILVAATRPGGHAPASA